MSEPKVTPAELKVLFDELFDVQEKREALQTQIEALDDAETVALKNIVTKAGSGPFKQRGTERVFTVYKRTVKGRERYLTRTEATAQEF